MTPARRVATEPPLWSLRRYLRLARSDVARFKFLLEGYDNLGYLSVLDRFEAVAVITCAPGQEQDLDEALGNIGATVPFQVLWRSG